MSSLLDKRKSGPEPAEVFTQKTYVEDDQEAVVEAVFSVQLLDENLDVVGVETLHSTNYPKETTIKWCLLKNRSRGAVYASVRKLYELQY